MRFDWDKNKNISNINKHGISFKDASEIFFDKDTIYIPDPDHSEMEDRWIAIGNIKFLEIIVVVFVDKSSDREEVLRIVSARKATKKEQKQFVLKQIN